uniref:Major facilitator transporter n=1 Tax=uncultured bacterium W4-21b TaxID=1130993 RepID=H9BWM1_9BACT|nr:major facilitator transporter [uncultured bacterium W4-21b]
MKILSPLLWTLLADKVRSRRNISLLTAIGSTLVFIPCFWVRDFRTMFVVVTLYAFFRMGILPLIEAATWESVETKGIEYGKVRYWGSVGFVLTVSACGFLFDIIPLYSMIYFITVLSVILILAVTKIPKDAESGPKPKAQVSFLSSFKKPGLIIFLVTAIFIQMSHGAYYGFFAIFMEDLGFARYTIGVGWALAVLCEIVLMIRFRRWFGQRSPQTLMLISCFIAAWRWFVMAQTESLMVLLLVQSTHAFTFAAFHISSLAYLNKHIPARIRTSAIGLLSALSFGVGGTIGLVLSGYLYEAVGPRSIFTAAGFLALCASVFAIGLHIISMYRPAAQAVQK